LTDRGRQNPRGAGQEGIGGKVLVVGQPESIMVRAVRQIGEEYGIPMLPSLNTPFSAGTCALQSQRSCLQSCLQARQSTWPRPVEGRLARIVVPAENRCPHPGPQWSGSPGADAPPRLGRGPPAYFIPDDKDPHFRSLSEFVIGRAIEDWHHLLVQQGPVDLSINLPASFLSDPDVVRELCQRMPKHPAFGGLLIEIDSNEGDRESGARDRCRETGAAA